MLQNSFFIRRLAERGDAVVFQNGTEKVVASALLERSFRLAHALEKKGFGPGDRAILAAPTGRDFLAVVFGCMAAGLDLALIDPEMGLENYRQKMRQLEPKLAFVDARILLLQEHPVARWAAKKWLGVPTFPAFLAEKTVAMGGWLPIFRRHERLENWLEAGFEKSSKKAFSAQNLPENDRKGPFLITYTSGTVAEPKGVWHTLDGLERSISRLAELLGPPAGQRIATHLGHYVLLGISAGIEVVGWSPRWSPRRKIEFIEREKITTLFGPPSDFVPLLDFLEAEKSPAPGCLRRIMLGSAPVFPSFLSRLRAVLPPQTEVVCLYGMTENLVVAATTAAEKLGFSGKGDLVGHPVGGVEVRIASDSELELRSPQLFEGYFQAAKRPDWHPTGDLARLTDDGRIVLIGRKKDMAIRRNFNIYPALYEPTIARIEGVADCALVGVYDEKRADERLFLAIEPTAAWAEKGQFLQQKVQKASEYGPFSIDAEARPDEIWVGKLPRSGRSQKVDKAALRRFFGEHF